MKKIVTHYEHVMDKSSFDDDLWRTFYRTNFRDHGYDGTKAYIQATIDYLRCKGFQVLKEENKNVDTK